MKNVVNMGGGNKYCKLCMEEKLTIATYNTKGIA